MTRKELNELVKEYQPDVDMSCLTRRALNELEFVNRVGVPMFTLTLGLEKPVFKRNKANSISQKLKNQIRKNYDKWFPIVAQLGKKRTIRIFSNFDKFKAWSVDYQNHTDMNLQLTDNLAGAMFTRETVPQQWELWDAETVAKRHFTD